jgi:hypothetical protein
LARILGGSAAYLPNDSMQWLIVTPAILSEERTEQRLCPSKNSTADAVFQSKVKTMCCS